MRRSAVSLVATTHAGGHHVCRQYAGNFLGPTFAAKLDDADFVGARGTGCSISVARATDGYDSASPIAATLATCVFGAIAGAAPHAFPSTVDRSLSKQNVGKRAARPTAYSNRRPECRR